MNLITKLEIIYATACHASLCTTCVGLSECQLSSCHCCRAQPLLLYTDTARGGGWGLVSQLQKQLCLYSVVLAATNC